MIPFDLFNELLTLRDMHHAIDLILCLQIPNLLNYKMNIIEHLELK